MLPGKKNLHWTDKMTIRDEVKTLKITTKTLREFGLLIGGIFTLLGGLGLWNQHLHGYVLILIGLSLIIPGIFFPDKLRQPYIYWMTMALMMGWVMTRVILTLFYLVAMFPISLIARFKNYEFLDRDPKKVRESYWVAKTDKRNNDSYHKQF